MKATSSSTSKPYASRRGMTILVAAIVGILGVVLFLRHETEVPPKAIQVDKGAATTAVKMTQPNSAPFETEESPAVPARPTEERYPNAKSLDLIRPSPSNQDQYLRILAGPQRRGIQRSACSPLKLRNYLKTWLRFLELVSPYQV